MRDILHGKWIVNGMKEGMAAPFFRKVFSVNKVLKATLYITALGVYEATINGVRVGQFVMAPGWTDYEKRLQVQAYDITALLQMDNELCVTVGRGWYGSRLGWDKQHPGFGPVALIATMRLQYADGRLEDIVTDESWQCAGSNILCSTIYDGETADGRIQPQGWQPAVSLPLPKDNLIPQEGENICEQENLSPVAVLRTPKGENVIDFGQNLTGYVQFDVSGPAGHTVTIRHAEVLDRDGNFYTANLRSAKAEYTCILAEGANTFKPRFTFFGFRYIQLINWPEEIKKENFTAIVVHSHMKRTGQFECGNPLVNKLYQNIVWGQKGNFLDVPTDCPQRDERLGWTGDAQVFARTAAYNFDVHKFFQKWLHDLKSCQYADGSVPAVIPDVLTREAGRSFGTLMKPEARGGSGSAAWGDAACICPWQMYISYGDSTLLAEQFESMRSWVEYIRRQGTEEALWDTGTHYGDWLGLDAPSGSYKGSTDEGLIATAMYANSVYLLVKAGKVLGRDVGEYEELHGRIKTAFRAKYMMGGKLICNTQTAHVLALRFDLCEDKAKVAASLAKMITDNGTHLSTGFVGTPYLLHVLTENGYAKLAYSLLVQESFPSWLFSVKMGATTIWEHWDGLREDGTMWSTDMNSFNHYAYGAVGDWIFSVAAGISPVEEEPGYVKVRIAPIPDERLGFVKSSLETPHGFIRSEWRCEGDSIHYEIEIPQKVQGEIFIGGKTQKVNGGIFTMTTVKDFV
jgi:alpha-L-rhamnosidase